jgi:hypothetical protein
MVCYISHVHHIEPNLHLPGSSTAGYAAAGIPLLGGPGGLLLEDLF